MNEYEVTYSNGEVIEVEAWTPILAEAIAEEEAEADGKNLKVTDIKLLAAHPIEW